ncbi:MAG: hypothetical protein LQ343_003810 [Gyalolechia ehrenbergii]|nr:MAG: hypothetical protein LQ343_003810 [Gyalolechia ehrenbergii]
MPDTGLDARIKFLENSAHLLRGTVPETSAHLMQQRNVVAEESDKSLNKAQLKDICRACGVILVSGSISKVSVAEKVGKKKRTFVPEPEAFEEQSKIECLSCHRVTVTSMQQLQENMRVVAKPVPLAKPSSIALSETIPSSDSRTEEMGKPASANASSKKRARARKQGGLQALLEKSKGTDSSSGVLGLDLMDFMKET